MEVRAVGGQIDREAEIDAGQQEQLKLICEWSSEGPDSSSFERC
jgi:hypothetical protein